MLNRAPLITLSAKPEALRLRAPETAWNRYDAGVRSAAKAENEIEILGEIGESFWSENFTTAKMVKDQLKAFGKNPVVVTINSPGGDAFEGVAIYNLLRAHPAAVTVKVIGLAASAASIIAMAGDRVEMGEGAFMMIHSAHGITAGNQEEMRQFADLLNSIDEAVAKLYATRTGQSESAMLALMQAETWMDGPEAVAEKFADSADKKKAKAAAVTKIRAHAAVSLLAAPGLSQRPEVRMSATPGASGSTPTIKGPTMKTTAMQIAAFEAKRAALVARRDEIQAKAIAESRSKDEKEKTEFDAISAELATVDSELVDLRLIEADAVRGATTVAGAVRAAVAVGAIAASAVSAASGIVSVSANVQQGQGFARLAMALYQSNGNPQQALQSVRANRRWMDTTPELEKVLMTAVATGDTTTAGWASELVYAQNLQGQFIEYLRPKTIIGRLPSLRRVPFNIRMGSQTGASVGYWVGQAKPIPVSKLTTSSLSLGITKAAGICTVDDELMKSSSPSVELLVRDDLAKSVIQLTDLSFLDPNQFGITNVQPASILSGVTPIDPSGTNAAAVATDVAAVFAAAIAANLDPSTGVWIMSPTTALKLSLMLTANGVPQYPGISINGGLWMGLPVVVSQQAKIAGSPQFGEMIVLVLQEEILLADEGQVEIEVSREAALELLDNPTNTGAGATAATSMVSMFQTHSAAIKAVRYMNWVKRRSAAAAFIQAANYHA